MNDLRHIVEELLLTRGHIKDLTAVVHELNTRLSAVESTVQPVRLDETSVYPSCPSDCSHPNPTASAKVWLDGHTWLFHATARCHDCGTDFLFPNTDGLPSNNRSLCISIRPFA